MIAALPRPTIALGWLLAVACLGLVGCRTVDIDSRPMDLAVAAPQLEPPRELAKMSLPPYRIEPPDVVQLQMGKVIPLTPYKVDVYDVLWVSVKGTPQEEPIEGYYMVDMDGKIQLGFSYGGVQVRGLDLQESPQGLDVAEAIATHLEARLQRPEVTVRLGQSESFPRPDGNYLVGPDGTINLRQYGRLYVAGLTLPEAEQAVREQLKQFFSSPQVWLDVMAYNSKVYYIVTQGSGAEDNVVRVPITGNETVLDAVSQVGGLSPVSSKRVWIARPSPGESACEQVLPVDWNAVVQGGSTATNYQVLPGDRVFIAQDKTIALSSYLGKVIEPFERVTAFGTLGASTVRNFQTLGRGYNQNRNNF